MLLDHPLVLRTLLALFGWCILYAVFLNWKPIYTFYTSKKLTFLTVVVGNVWILAALWYLESHGVPLSARLVFYTFVAAGLPIIFWQLLQIAHEKGMLRSDRLRNGGGRAKAKDDS
jgi:hypothetical protein